MTRATVQQFMLIIYALSHSFCCSSVAVAPYMGQEYMGLTGIHYKRGPWEEILRGFVIFR